MNIIGLDPGLKGGYAILGPSRGQEGPSVSCGPLPLTSEGIIDCRACQVALTSSIKGDVTVYLEQVHAMPKQGVSSMFTFGKGYGQLIGMCQVMEWPITFVTPQAWQKALKLICPHMSKLDKWTKDHSVAFCEARYPGINLLASARCSVPHDGMADALCIAHYGSMMIRPLE